MVAAALVAAATGVTLSTAAPALAAESCASAGPCVVVHGADQSQQLSRADLLGLTDITNGVEYDFRNASGTTSPLAFVSNGISINHLLDHLHLTPAFVSSVDIAGTGGGSATTSTLTHDEVQEPAPFAENLAPVLNLDNGAASTDVEYIRPLLDSPTDHNAFVLSGSNAVLDVTVNVTRQVAHVSISATQSDDRSRATRSASRPRPPTQLHLRRSPGTSVP